MMIDFLLMVSNNIRSTLVDLFWTDIECHDITDGHSEVMVETVISNELSENKVITNKMIEYERRIQELERQLKLTKDLLSEKICDNNSSAAQVNVGQMSTTEDEYYVSSYSHYSIHYEMLSDTIRTKAYQDAILNNGQFFQGKTVLDIGCGTGILSLFAAKAGAELVVAVDHSDIIYKAMEFAIENHLDSRIKFIKGKLEAINFEVCQLPTKYDVIISEWMGYFLLFEGMLDSVLYARNQLLANSGLLLPNTCSLALAGISDKQLKHRFIDFWDDVYGFRMSSMKNEIISEALIDTVDKETINTSVFVVRQFDLMTISLEESQSFETQFQLTALSDKPVLAFAGWFDCHFNASQLTQSVTLSTSPFNCGTHWKQTLFVLKKPIECKSGDTINGQIKVYRNVKEIRSLVVEVKISGRNKQTFFLS